MMSRREHPGRSRAVAQADPAMLEEWRVTSSIEDVADCARLQACPPFRRRLRAA